ncbi:MAG: Structural maintenance of chromosomes protein 6 [Alyxoria varia]|nr:MAG: Structural maintenance of chromosomes protein 6 [Alyxoria varia]
MPSRKRQHREADQEEDVDVVESASSDLRREPPANKRLRVDGRPARNSTASRETSLEIDSGEAPSTQFQRQNVSFLKQHEEERDRDMDDADDEDLEAELAALDQCAAKPGAETGNRAAENGVLESVVCTNFMCHSKLSVTFGPLINFIIGHNGSGKSAVLTAIQICLGGKATSTNRGQTLKAFIKEGQESATLSVKIKNSGDNAYKKDLYGRSIIVERSFTMKGTSGFKVKSVDGKIMSTKRAEVDEINDFYALQLDNPVNVLTQDQSRQFLNNSSSAKKYELLIKGVLLEQLDRDYVLVAESLDNLEHQMDNQKENCRVFRERFEEAERKRGLIQQGESLRDKIRAYTRQLAWVQVEDQERELGVRQKNVATAQQKIESCEQSAERYKEAFDRSERDLAEAQHKKAELDQELAPYTERQQEVREQVDRAKEELTSVQSDARQANGSMQNCKQQVQKYQQAIDDEMQRLEEVNGGAEPAKRAEIVQHSDQMKALKEEQTRLRDEVPDLEKQKSGFDEQAKRIGAAEHHKKNELSDAKRMLQALQQDQGNQNKAFPPSLPKLRDAIERDGRFKDKPVGPMGLHVRLLKPQWSSVIEKTFGGSLDYFVVTSAHDQKILKDLMDKTRYPTVGILIGNKNRLNTSEKEPDSQYDTIMRCLEIDNDLVRNQLIIHNYIDQQILIENQNEAINTFEHVRPRNMAGIFCFHKTEAGKGFRFSWGRGNTMKQDPVDAWNGFPRMRTDIAAQIRMKTDAVEKLRTELGDIERKKTDAQKKATGFAQQISQNGKQIKVMTRKIQEEQDTIDKLNEEIQLLNPQEGTLDGHKANLNEAQEDFEYYRQQMEEITGRQNEIAENAEQLEEELKNAVAELDGKNKEIEKSAKKIKKLEDKRSDKLRDKNAAIAQIEDAKADKAHAEANYRDQEDLIKEFISQAEQVSLRIPVERGETHDSLTNKVNKFQADLDRFEREVGGDTELITRLAFEAREVHYGHERHFKGMVKLSETLANALRERRGRWKHFRQAISSRARSEFMELMKRRGMYGKMVIDHHNKLLELQVDPNASTNKRQRKSGDQQGRQTRTLSGGEKSFSTICMLLALWEAMGSPIRCLDEFDVFMDSVNRDQSMRMLIDAARDNVGRQFVLITPQAMGSAELGTDVKVIRLSDPERGQTTLNLPGA